MLMADDAGRDEAKDNRPPSLGDFSTRLDAMRGKNVEKSDSPKSSGAAWGRAMRLSSELLAGLFVGTVLGIVLDRFLGTTPWFLLAGIGIGFAAGLRNISRAMAENNEDNGS